MITKYSRRAYQTLSSNEYIEYTVISETTKLLNMRCLDLGYIPFALGNKVKLWGPPYIASNDKDSQ
jgi:hypothetical protein